jgi:hypothetical protein
MNTSTIIVDFSYHLCYFPIAFKMHVGVGLCVYVYMLARARTSFVCCFLNSTTTCIYPTCYLFASIY